MFQISKNHKVCVLFDTNNNIFSVGMKLETYVRAKTDVLRPATFVKVKGNKMREGQPQDSLPCQPVIWYTYNTLTRMYI